MRLRDFEGKKTLLDGVLILGFKKRARHVNSCVFANTF
jgi:hypothetical protein